MSNRLPLSISHAIDHRLIKKRLHTVESMSYIWFIYKKLIVTTPHRGPASPVLYISSEITPAATIPCTVQYVHMQCFCIILCDPCPWERRRWRRRRRSRRTIPLALWFAPLSFCLDSHPLPPSSSSPPPPLHVRLPLCLVWLCFTWSYLDQGAEDKEATDIYTL